MTTYQNQNTLQPDQQGFGALVERVAHMTLAVEKMTAETQAMRKVVEGITSDQIKMQAEIRLLTVRMENTERELRADIERRSIRKLWGDFTSVVAGLVSIFALLVALGMVRG